MAARAGFEQQCKGRIARDIDLVDRVHLDGDIQGHRNTPAQTSCGAGRMARGIRQGRRCIDFAQNQVSGTVLQ
jgi:hypothetical protein